VTPRYPLTTWQGLCGHRWDRAVWDSPVCPLCPQQPTAEMTGWDPEEQVLKVGPVSSRSQGRSRRWPWCLLTLTLIVGSAGVVLGVVWGVLRLLGVRWLEVR
jgi:hypothetical protein